MKFASEGRGHGSWLFIKSSNQVLTLVIHITKVETTYKMHAPRLATQSDIAKKLGLSRAAVSYALRDHPKVSPQVREEVRRAAAELGYQPDPAFSALSHRRHQPGLSSRATLALLVGTHDFSVWKKSPSNAELVHGVVTACRELGYGLDIFAFGHYDLGSTALSRILKARGVLVSRHAALVESRTELLIAGRWQEGKTLRPRQV